MDGRMYTEVEDWLY